MSKPKSIKKKEKIPCRWCGKLIGKVIHFTLVDDYDPYAPRAWNEDWYHLKCLKKDRKTFENYFPPMSKSINQEKCKQCGEINKRNGDFCSKKCNNTYYKKKNNVYSMPK